MALVFKDRKEAGILLAKKFQQYKGKKGAIVLAIPRGGLEIGNAFAKELKLPLDVIIVKKIGHPFNPELAVGAVGLGGELVLNEDVALDVPKNYIEQERKRLGAEVERRYKFFRGEIKPPNLKDKTVIIIDDGIATGATAALCVKSAKKANPKKVILAIPVGPMDGVEKMREIADEVVCLETPKFFGAVGEFYGNFQQVEDEEAKEYLEEIEKIMKQGKITHRSRKSK